MGLNNIHEHNINIKTREIFLIPNWYGEDNSDPGIDYKLAQMFLKNILLLDSMNHKPIIVHQFSTGGDWDSGMTMYDAIKHVQSPVVMVMHGTAISCGTVVPQAANYRYIMPNCTFMIHVGTTDISDSLTHKQAQSWAKHEEKLQEKMLEIYTQSCMKAPFFQNYTKEKVKEFISQLMDKHDDCFLVPAEVVKYGFADDILYGGSSQLAYLTKKLEEECTQN